MKQRNLKPQIRFYSLLCFIISPVFIFLLGWYFNRITVTELFQTVMNPFFIIAFIMEIGFAYGIVSTGLKKIDNYSKFQNETMLLKAQKVIRNLPKAVIYAPVIVNMAIPQFVITFMEYNSLENRIIFLLLSYAVTILLGIGPYIVFIRRLEFHTQDIEFNEQLMSMGYSVRNILVIFLSISSIIVLGYLSIHSIIDSRTADDQLFRSIMAKTGPVIGMAGALGIFNNVLLAVGIGQRLKVITDFMTRLSKNDLSTKRVGILSRDEFGVVFKDINLLSANLRKTIATIKKSTDDTLAVKDKLIEIADETSSSAVQISSNIESVNNQINTLDDNISQSTETIKTLTGNIDKLGTDIQEQASMVEESTASITEMIASIDSITQIAHRKAQATEVLIKTAEDGGKKLSETISRMEEITDGIENIKEITSLIMGISARTNLLAMNAAIEAAHAGQAGRGFSVVADEIRKLAENSSRSSKKINETIKTIIENIEKSSESAETTDKAFADINSEIHEVVQSFKEIETGVSELKIGGDQILRASTGLQDISTGVKQQADEMTEKTGSVSRAVEELKRISTETRGASEEITRGTQDILEATEELSRRSTDLNQFSSVLKENIEKFEI